MQQRELFPGAVLRECGRQVLEGKKTGSMASTSQRHSMAHEWERLSHQGAGRPILTVH
jgi:hypothetical protein